MSFEPKIDNTPAYNYSANSNKPNKSSKNSPDINSTFDDLQNKIKSGKLSDTEKDDLISKMEGLIGDLPEFDAIASNNNKLTNTSIFDYSKANSEKETT